MIRLMITAAFLVLTTGPAFGADPSITAEFGDGAPPNSSASFGGERGSMQGQSFEAELGGTVSSIECRVSRYSDAEVNWVVALFAVGADGLPTDEALMSQTVSGDRIGVSPDVRMIRFDFESGATIEAGETYAIVLRFESAIPDVLGFWSGTSGYETGTPYADGTAFYNWDGTGWTHYDERYDRHFRVSVDPATPTQTKSWSAVKGAFVHP